MSSKPDSEVSDAKFAERLERQANDGHGWNKVPDMLREAAKRLRDRKPMVCAAVFSIYANANANCQTCGQPISRHQISGSF